MSSAFEDRYNNVYFKITFYSSKDGWAADINIDGLPIIKSNKKYWPTKEDAHNSAVVMARRMIDKLKPPATITH